MASCKWLLLLILGVFFPVNAADKADLEVEVSGLAPGEGQLIVSLFDEKKAWLKESREVLREKVGDGESLIVVFPGLDEGQYAVSVVYDQDGDGKMATGMFGIPKEPVGFSNNVRGKFGPAKWKQTHFYLDGDMRISIQVMDAIQ